MAEWWDWPELRHTLRVDLVARDLKTVVRPGIEVRADGGQVSYDYFGSDKASAALTVPNGDQSDTAWVRIWHDVAREDGSTWTECMGTFVGRDSKMSTVAGGMWRDLDLQSALWAMRQDYDPYPVAVQKGGSVRQKCEELCAAAMRPMAWEGRDAHFLSTRVIPVGDARSENLRNVCGDDKQVWLRDDGYVLIRDYVSPHQRTASMTIRADGTGSHVIVGTLARNGTRLSTPNRVVVTHQYAVDVTNSRGETKQEEHVTAGYADTGTEADARLIDSRGVRVTSLKQVDEMSPETPQEASRLARIELNKFSPTVEWTLDATWMPLRAGEVVMFSPGQYATDGDDSYRRCQVKSVDVDLRTWVLHVSMKEV